MQVSLPGSAREPGVWFVLAGFVKIAALTMSMGTSPFGEQRKRPFWMVFSGVFLDLNVCMVDRLTWAPLCVQAA